MLRSVQHRLRVVTLSFFFLFLQLLTAQTLNDSGFSAQQFVILPAYRAVDLQSAPDGRVFVWQKDGIISLMKNGALVSTPVLDIRSQVNAAADRGMIGFFARPELRQQRLLLRGLRMRTPLPPAQPRKRFAPRTWTTSMVRFCGSTSTALVLPTILSITATQTRTGREHHCPVRKLGPALRRSGPLGSL